MRKCGNCNKPGHNRRTCNDPYGSRQPILRRGPPPRQPRQPQPQPFISPVVKVTYSCPGINGVGSHTFCVLESDSSFAIIMPKERAQAGGGGNPVLYCPTHKCRLTRI